MREEIHKYIEKSREVDLSPYNISKFRGSIALDYMLNSKFTPLKIKKLSSIVTKFYHPFILSRAAQPYKRYEDKKKFSFDGYKSPKEKNIFSVIKKRKSTKKYEKKEISIQEIYYILHYSYGIMRMDYVEGIPWHFRPIPSPGGLFSSEVYLLLLNSHMPKGLYHYRPDINSVELIKEGDFSDFVIKSCGIDPYIESIDTISGVIFTTTLIERLYTKYSERSYRFMLLEVGFLAQNISLISEALDIGTCMVGGYIDDEINEFIGIDGLLETIQNVMVIGYKK
ncbi:SagB family peptide dehydrogenase [Riemerella anatipestifer]|uniref:SagB family peptide dehydrogenase n=1 Tax=Riemerella anatipestifer TaxID=34085 RepID=UPI001BDA8025|nr:SagB family peptide dehydrogenase [Riemerella anatipestifer]MBT0553057.1 SagB family peptide dehydrogenase [Riemerella anatipestifer]MCT6745080.1 SagB family peptide dehydrogenase [Riemerella anatipestifer]MCU7572328.1 SagB family peptide dehydrogenase [Riemerella anatipestifer]MCU7597086.1 SagB family peptide dehydrogenase [Riemerella anatipestifer]MCU7603712.1 SagB family peptide dehydrogenase [Riemerella anatipestifer]